MAFLTQNVGDEIMADKGFNIRDLADKIGVKLNLPIFLGSRPQFEAAETVINQRTASNRICGTVYQQSQEV